jgi:hypothetical protein
MTSTDEPRICGHPAYGHRCLNDAHLNYHYIRERGTTGIRSNSVCRLEPGHDGPHTNALAHPIDACVWEDA